jgi:hypothetical protein
MGLGDELIDVIAIDALKHAQLEPDARTLDLSQDHWPQTFGTGVGLNRYAAWIEQDCKGWHDANLNQGASITELSVTDRCRLRAVMKTPWTHRHLGAVPFCSLLKSQTD